MSESESMDTTALETGSEEIDIEKIMKKIRTDIVERGFTNDVLPFDMIGVHEKDILPIFEMQSLEQSLAQYSRMCNVEPYPMISASYGGILGRFILLFKKTIRKCINFHVTPLVFSINNSNQQVLDVLVHLRDFVKVQLNQINEEERLDAVEFELNHKLKKNNTLLEQRINEVEKQNHQLIKILETYENTQNELMRKITQVES